MSNLFHKEHLKVMKHIIIFIFIQQVITTMIGVIPEALVRYANDQNYTARFSRSNPLAGDPENAYDIDFTPSNAGNYMLLNF